MTVVRSFATRAEALDAAEHLIEFGLEARVVDSEGRFEVTIAAGSRTVALDILDHGRPRFGRMVAWERARKPARLTTTQFTGAAAVFMAVLVLWIGLTDAYGARMAIVAVATVAVIGGGLFFVTPEAYETDEMQPVVAEAVALGILIALAQRIVFDVVPLPASPYRVYPLWLWVAATMPTAAVFVALVGRLVRRRGVGRIRQTMTLFGGAALAYSAVGAATYIIDLGFTSERWGLVPVWAVLGIYPVLTVPLHVFAGGLFGWGWAVGGRSRVFAFTAVVTGLGLFHFSIVRSPFWGPLVVIGFAAAWALVFVRNPQNDPMVDPVPDRLLRQCDE